MTLSPSKQDAPLVLKLAELARSSPRAWSEFLAEFRKYSDRVKDQCVYSSPEHLQVQQGRARESASLTCMFEECVVAADKLTTPNRRAQT